MSRFCKIDRKAGFRLLRHYKEEDISLFDFKQSGKIKTDYSNSIIDTTNFNENTIDFVYNAKFDWLDFRANTHLSSLENSLPKYAVLISLQ